MINDAISRFFSNVNRGESCWQWKGRREAAGYGVMQINKRLIKAHRFSYLLQVGRIPSGLQIDHLCRNRACVNPDHLEPVTQHENWRRGIAPSRINADKTHCIRGHEFTSENIYSDGKGRHCKPCAIDRERAKYIANPEAIKAMAAAYRERNREIIRQKAREYYYRKKAIA